MIVTLIGSVLLALAGRTILGTFTDNQDIIAMGVWVLVVDVFLEIGRTSNIFAGSTLRATGDIVSPSLIKAIVPHIAFNKSVWGSMRDKVDFELVPTRELQAQARKTMNQDNDEAIGAPSGGSGSGGNNGGTADPGDVTP